jgi:hypothetical protein
LDDHKKRAPEFELRALGRRGVHAFDLAFFARAADDDHFSAGRVVCDSISGKSSALMIAAGASSICARTAIADTGTAPTVVTTRSGASDGGNRNVGTHEVSKVAGRRRSASMTFGSDRKM